MYISVASLPVDDIDRAIDFYTKKLGWEKTMDAPMGEDPDDRWVTVAPPGAQTALALSKGFGNWSPEKVGQSTGLVIEVDDVFKTHDAFVKNGIEFAEEPANQSFGGWAMFKDSEGNILGLHSGAPAAVSNN